MNAPHRSFLRVVALCASIVTCCILAGCTKTGEARTRAAQEAAFKENFGFAPPASVTEIQYADHYQRGVVDGSYEQWMRLTFQADVFDQMVKTNGYQKQGRTTLISGPNKPQWWPQNMGGDYAREGNDGASYHAHLWREEKAGWVYWYQTWSD